MKPVLPAISGLALAVFPLFVLVGIRFLELSSLWLILIGLLAVRTLSARWFARLSLLPQLGLCGLIALLGMLPLGLDMDLMLGIRFYPVAANMAAFSLFFSSLFADESLVERIARMHRGPLPPEGRRYTRQVTRVWCVFLFANMLMALTTALWASDVVWGLYNGLISYCLVVILFVVEYFVRSHVKQRWSS